MSESANSNEKKDSKISKTLNKFKNIKHIEIIIAVIAVAVMLFIYFGAKIGSNSEKSDKVDQSPIASDYCNKMESDLKEVLGGIVGVGKLKLAINWSSSVESVIAYITNNSGNSSTSTPQIIQGTGGGKPIVLKEIYPKALGVIIVCEGGGNVGTKLDIINAVSVLLDITPDKISVYAMVK